ncbi:MAG: hypothetical protein FWF24_07515 [Alphaproteobacteria bacterium]|nr:hypothetical protein [Alphaproteobacteria bacterium]
MVDSTKIQSTPIRTLPLSGQAAAQAPKPGQQAPAAKAAPTAQRAARPQTMGIRHPRKGANFSTTPFWMGMFLSIGWAGIVAFVLSQAVTTQTFAGLPLVTWAIGISAVVAPVAMIWMIAAYLQRAADVQSVTEPLRRQLAMITGESGAAEVRVRRFNHAIKEQLDLLRSTKNISDEELMSLMDRINEHKNDLESFEQNSLYQVKEIQDVIRRSMQHIEQLMEDKFAMLRILDNKLTQSGEDVARQTESIRDHIGGLLQDVQASALTVASSVERAAQNSKRLSETAHAQETSLVSAAETAASTLSELSGKIDGSIAHFLSRTGLAREEAEKLASTLDTQTRALDELSNFLPARITEAESILRGVADRLYASEELARDQADSLAGRLEQQMDNMQTLLDRFTHRVKEVDGGLIQRRQDLEGLVVRIAGVSDDLAQQMDTAVNDLGNRADATLAKFSQANDKARQGTDDIALQLAETAARYEAATRHLGALSEANSAQLKTSTREIAEQLAQFNALQQASQQAGQEVQARASIAAQNLQQVLDRLLSTRDATQNIGEVLTEKLRATVDQNERVITRINEAARMTVHALGTATESLTRQEKEITLQSQVAETALRDTTLQLQEQAQETESTLRAQNDALITMLRDIRGRLDTTDQHLKDFADFAAQPVQEVVTKINQAARHGGESMDQYGRDMQTQLERLEAFNAQITLMSSDVSRMTSDTLMSIEDTNRRFTTLREVQEDTNRRAVDQFNAMAERLSSEVGTLGGKASEAAQTLQQAAVQVGQQSYQLQAEAKDSEVKLNAVIAALQKEAVSTRTILEGQTESINHELTRAGARFTELSQALKEKAEGAYSLLDRVALHYTKMTSEATQDFELRARTLDETASSTTGKVQALNAAMESQLAMISSGESRIEIGAQQLERTGTRAIENLERIHDKFLQTQNIAVTGTNEAVDKMHASLQTFQGHHLALNEASENAVQALDKAGIALGSQADTMRATTVHIEQTLAKLNQATTLFAEQSTQIRSTMEQHNTSLVESLRQSVRQLDETGKAMQTTAASAIENADMAQARYSSLSESARTRLDSTTHDLLSIADKTENTLGALSTGITKQVAALNLMGEQIATQHRVLTETNETQRSQLVALFEKLGSAHNEASSVAERTIARLIQAMEQIENHIRQISGSSQSALENVESASSGFATQSSSLIAHARAAEEQARTALSVTSSLQDQARQLRDALHAEVDRTSVIMTELLTQLTTGSATMHDVGGTASMLLETLQSGLNRQVTSLNDSMDQITQRQHHLSSALDAQREAMGSLTSRLMQIQDETTAGTGAITAQLDHLDTHAGKTLASIHTAGESFSQETSALIAGTQNAAQQVKNLVDQAEAMQRRAGDICASLRTETHDTSGVLNAAVGQIETRAKDLRSTSTATEESLNNLSATISQQTTAINTNLSTIAQKQGDLDSAMDSQRQMLADMITRLTLAHDETVAAAERSTMRLADSTSEITSKMDELDGRTQNTMAALRAVSTAIANETENVSGHTQAAEAQVRAMLQATSGIYNEARMARGALQTETEKMTENLADVMTRLESTVDQMKTQSTGVTSTMDKAALDFSAMAQNAGETLQKQATSINNVMAQSGLHIEGVNERMRESIKLITDASDISDTHGRRLMETAERATTKLVAMISTLADSDKESKAALDQATQRLAQSRTALESELQTIAALSAKATEQVLGAGSTLAIQSDALRANLASSESALNQAAGMVREELIQIPAILNRSASDIETATKTFKGQTADITDTMLKTTDRCISTAGAIRDTIMDEASNLDQVAATAESTLRKFNDAIKDQVHALKSGATLLSGEQKDLVEKASQTIGELSAASDRLAKLRGDTQQTTAKLAHEFAAIESRATSTTQKLTAAGDTLSKQIAGLAAMTEKSEGQMAAASHSFREQLEQVRGGVQTQIDDINRGLMQITAQLDRTGTSLRSVMAGTVVDVEKISSRFDQTSKDTANQLTDRTARMRVATEEVAKLLSGFGDQIDGLLGRLSTAGEMIKRHEGDLSGNMHKAFTQLGAVAEKLNATRVMTETVSEAATQKLATVAQALDKQMRQVAEGGQTVTSIIQNVTQTYGDQVGRMTGGITNAQQQIVTMTQAIEQMQQRTDRMRVTLKLQGDDLMSSLEDILGRLSSTGHAMSFVSQDSAKKIS